MKLCPWMTPPVPPGEPTGLNKERPGQCVKADWVCGVEAVRPTPSWQPKPGERLGYRYGENT